ncbi:MAG: AAA family ATPase, partial [Oscillospiraceae bacterium]|nr:AAA family ATPase [Oscillospiraceae bacterium]
MRKQRLPIGVDNFEKLRNENLYYVDKTLLIKELLDSWSEVT